MLYTYPMYENTLAHSGVLGMKWGIRRFQNEDGTLTEAGKKRYAKLERKNEKLERKIVRAESRATTYKMMSRKREHKAEKLSRGIIGAVLPLGKARARHHAFKAMRLSIKSADYERIAARSKERIYKNKKFMEKLTTPISQIDSSTVEKGKKVITQLVRG